MNWRVVAPLGLTGALPPVLSLFLAGSPIVAAIAWTALAALVWVPAMIWTRDAQPFLSLVVVGGIAGVVAGIIDVLTRGDPMLFVMALFLGVAWGALFGGIAYLVAKRRAVVQ